ncbi:spore germination protein [Paenibacillus sp. 2TAB26]|uniref:spore germination protein n=1 Tax=Paenibacillus sp. 2TAB26 TaxID=3233005 RepID=UPI003F979749
MKAKGKLGKYFRADLSFVQNDFSLGNWGGEADQNLETTEGATMPQISDYTQDYGRLSRSLAENLEWFKAHFTYPRNRGLIVREVTVGQHGQKGAVLFMDGQVDWKHLDRCVMVPIMNIEMKHVEDLDIDVLMADTFKDGKVTSKVDLGRITDSILAGSAAILFDDVAEAILVVVKGWEKRAIDTPRTEVVVRGANEGFTEELETNLSMIRRRLRTPDLIVETGFVGTLSRTEIAIVYIKTIANEELVAEVRKRIASIRYDYIGDSGTIEQLIEEHSNSIYPNILSTERPDWTAAHLANGYVSIMVNNSPFSLIVPAHFPLFLQTVEDTYLRWPYSSFIRTIRVIGFFVALYLPSIYVAVANFHQEMIPTTLMLAIAGSREVVPIPLAAEIFMLELMFEIIREAGVRIPSVIGPTIGIVGALILGQAAVQANIVSPIVVIITATTALASYTIPNYNMQFATRMLRFIYLLAASYLGLVGVVLLSLLLWTTRAAENSFGVPVLAPFTPHRPSSDSFLRKAIDKQIYRPFSIRPKDANKIPSSKAAESDETNKQGDAQK